MEAGLATTDEKQPLLVDGRRRSDMNIVGEATTVDAAALNPSSPVSPWRRRLGSFSILFTLTLERIAFYSLAANLFLFLNRDPLNWMSFNAMTASYVFTGVAYLTAIFGGWIADAYLGRFRTIIAGLLVYAAAYMGLAYVTFYGQELPPICRSKNDLGGYNYGRGNMSASQLWRIITDLREPSTRPIDNTLSREGLVSATLPTLLHRENCTWFIYIILIVIGFAVGTVRANIAPFGADQVENAGEEATRRFFNWFYWCINIGGFIAIGGVAYVQQAYGAGFFVGYLMAVAVIGLAIAVFIAGRPFYTVGRPTGSILVGVLKIVLEAYRSQMPTCQVRRAGRLQEVDSSSPSEASTSSSSAVFVVSSNGPSTSGNPTRLDMAKVRYGGSFSEAAVEDVKALGKIVIVFTALVPFWVVYFQMQTSFIAQGLHMKLNPFPFHLKNATSNSTIENTFTIPAAWLTLFDVVFLLILIPLMDRVVYPFLDSRQLHLSLLTKISLGMMSALAAVVVAGCLESFRLHLIHTNNSTLIVQVVGNTTYVAADLWIFWQVPQYALIGISEVFASVASLHFAYSRSPKSMQGIIMGLHCLSMGIGSIVGILFIEGVHGFFFSSRDFGSLNHGHLDYYFFLLGAIQLLTIVIFNVIAQYCQVDDDEMPVVDNYVGGVSSTEEADDIEPIFRRSRRRHKSESG